MRIREFQPDDLPTLKEITIAAFDGVSIDQNIEQRFGVCGGHEWGWRKARHVDDDVQSAPGGVYVAEIDGEIAGFITTRQDAAAGVGSIPNLAVRAEHRGRGVGRRLIEFALEKFRASGVALARIETLQQNTVGDTLYRKLGFEEVARQVHFAMRLESGDAVGDGSGSDVDGQASASQVQ